MGGVSPHIQRNPNRFHRLTRIKNHGQLDLHFEHKWSHQNEWGRPLPGQHRRQCRFPMLSTETDSALFFFKLAEGCMQKVGVVRVTQTARK